MQVFSFEKKSPAERRLWKTSPNRLAEEGREHSLLQMTKKGKGEQ